MLLVALVLHALCFGAECTLLTIIRLRVLPPHPLCGALCAGVLHNDWTELGGWTTTLPVTTNLSALQADTAFMTNAQPGAVATDLEGAGLVQGARTRINLVPTKADGAPYHVQVGADATHEYDTGMGLPRVQYARP